VDFVKMARVPEEVREWSDTGDKTGVLKRLDNVVVWEDDCFPPDLFIDVLIFAMNLPRELSEDRDNALRKAVEAGLLSFDREGNYEVRFGKGSSGYSFNPKLGRRLYFTNKGEGGKFLKKMSTGWGGRGRNPDLELVCEGEYPLSLPISFERWIEIYAKWDSSIDKRLEEMGVLVSKREGNGFRVVKPKKGGGKKKEYLHFGLGKRFFRTYEGAREFRRAVEINPKFGRLPIARYVDGEMVEEDYEQARADERDKEEEGREDEGQD
jgi:hypothetical protein